MKNNKIWLKWATELQAIAQNGLAYYQNDFEKQRYEEIQRIAAEIISEHSSYDMEYIINLFARETGYATPKLDIRGVVFKDNEILLVQERINQLWTLPGGWVDINESPSEAVTREIFEESGFKTKAIKLLALYDKQKHEHPVQIPHIYKSFFLCELLGGNPKTSIETQDVGFFARDNLPSLCPHRATSKQLQHFFEHHEHPNWPTDFD